MKDTIFRFRFVMATIFILAIYGLITYDHVLMFLHKHTLSFFVIFIPILLCSAFWATSRAIWLRACWAVFMPEIASIVAYTSSIIWLSLGEQTNISNIAFLDWVIIAVIMPYFALAEIYQISLMLIAFVITDYFLIRKGISK